MSQPVIPELSALLTQAAQRQRATSRPPVRRLRRAGALSVAALFATAGALAATHPWSLRLGGPGRGHVTTSLSPVPRAELALLGVLRRPQTPTDRSRSAQATLRFLVGVEEHGVRLASVRSLGVSPADPGTAIVIYSLVHQGLTDGTVPGGANDVCAMFPSIPPISASTVTLPDGAHRTVRTNSAAMAAISCGNASQLDAGRIGGAISSRQGYYVWGLVPDGVAFVRTRLASGRTKLVPVHSNFYDYLDTTAGSATVPLAGLTVSWLDAQGQPVGVLRH